MKVAIENINILNFVKFKIEVKLDNKVFLELSVQEPNDKKIIKTLYLENTFEKLTSLKYLNNNFYKTTTQF